MPVPYPSEGIDDDAAFAVGEGHGATFGDVNGDFDAVALGGPDTTPDPDDDDADADGFDDSVDDEALGGPDTTPGLDDADGIDAIDDGGFSDSLVDEGDLGGQAPPEGDRPVGFALWTRPPCSGT